MKPVIALMGWKRILSASGDDFEGLRRMCSAASQEYLRAFEIEKIFGNAGLCVFQAFSTIFWSSSESQKASGRKS